MIYHLTDLLTKMGAPEVREKGRMEWHSFDKARNCLAGFAEIRLEAGGEFLVAEMKQLRENYQDDNGQLHAQYEESFFLYAERTARPDHYRITRIAFDGADYGHPTKPLVELGLGVFHARALDISLKMIEQSFNKLDMMDSDLLSQNKNDLMSHNKNALSSQHKKGAAPRTAPPMMASGEHLHTTTLDVRSTPSLSTAAFPSAGGRRTAPRKGRNTTAPQKPLPGQSAPRSLTPAGFVPLERLAHAEQPRTGYGVVVPFRKREALRA